MTRKELETLYQSKETIELVELSLVDLPPLEREVLREELKRRSAPKEESLEVPWEVKFCRATFFTYAFVRMLMLYNMFNEGAYITVTSVILKSALIFMYLNSSRYLSKPQAISYYFLLVFAFGIPGVVFFSSMEFLVANPELVVVENLIVTIGQLIPIIGGLFVLKGSVRAYYGIGPQNA